MTIPRSHVQTRRLALILRVGEDLGCRDLFPCRERQERRGEFFLVAGAGKVEEIVDLVVGYLRGHGF